MLALSGLEHAASKSEELLNAIFACGLGGLYPNNPMHPDIPPKGRHKSELLIQFGKYNGTGPFSQLNRTIHTPQNSARGVLHAIYVAQDLGFCCEYYSCHILTSVQTAGGYPIVRFKRTALSNVDDFGANIRKLTIGTSTLVTSNLLARCSVITNKFMDDLWPPTKTKDVLHDLHYYCLMVQFLSLSFALVLTGYRSTAWFPVLRTKPSRILLAGATLHIVAWPASVTCCQAICSFLQRKAQMRQVQSQRTKTIIS